MDNADMVYEENTNEEEPLKWYEWLLIPVSLIVFLMLYIWIRVTGPWYREDIDL